MLLTSCTEKYYINEINQKVDKVVNGNTIELSSGMKVKLLGVKKTVSGKKYLEKFVLHHPVKLVVESDAEQYVTDFDCTINAYVNLRDAGRIAINGDMLRKRAAGLSSANVRDSLKAYKKYVKDENQNPLSMEELFEYAAPATMLVVTDKGSGTAFIINEEGLALTNAHVIEDASEMRVYFWDSKGKITGEGREITRITGGEYEDGSIDFALFNVPVYGNERLRHLNLAKDVPNNGAKVAALGNPDGKIGNITEGIVENFFQDDHIIQIGANINPGNSGGPVVDEYGRVVGISTWREQKVDDKGVRVYNLAFDIQYVKEYLDKNGYYYGGK